MKPEGTPPFCHPQAGDSRQQIFKLELQVEFDDELFLFELMPCLNFADSRSGVSHLRTPTRTLATATGVCLAPPTPPSPHERGANLTIPPCLAAQEASSTFILTIPNGRRHPRQLQVRPAARSVALGPALSLRRSALLARCRPARDSLNGSRRARAAQLPAIRERSRRARLFACTCRLPRRGLWVCALCVSCRVSMYVLLGTCGLSTD